VQMRRLLETSGPPPALPDAKRRAVVAPTSAQLAFMRMFQALVRGHAPPGFALECFADWREAVAWINEGRTPRDALTLDVVAELLRMQSSEVLESRSSAGRA
jgi:hypothetical protein